MRFVRSGSLVVSVCVALCSMRGGAIAQTSTPVSSSALDRKTGEALVVRWLVAQNEGDFAAYQALYAQSFTGTKRIGQQAKTFDRAAWLKDRKAMFKSKMKVTATPLEITRDGGVLVITVLQRFEQGHFADIGQKRLMVDLRPAAGPILAEEMLDSRVLPSRDACARALFPQGRKGRIGPDEEASSIEEVEAYDLGTDAFLCRVNHQGRGQRGVTVELAAVKRAKPWAVVQQITHDVSNEAELGTELDEMQVRESYDVTLQPISDTEQAFLLELQKKTSGPMHEDTATVSELFRVTPKGLVSLLRYETKWSDGEALRGTRCSLRQGDAEHAGLHDLELECVTTVGDYHNEDPDQRGEKETQQVSVYRWDGKKYAKRK